MLKYSIIIVILLYITGCSPHLVSTNDQLDNRTVVVIGKVVSVREINVFEHGAAMSTRAYRFKPLSINSDIFEFIDDIENCPLQNISNKVYRIKLSPKEFSYGLTYGETEQNYRELSKYSLIACEEVSE